MTIFKIWEELEKAGYHPTLQREDGVLTMRGVYLRNTAAQIDFSFLIADYLDYKRYERNGEEIRCYFEGDQDFVLVAEWNI